MKKIIFIVGMFLFLSCSHNKFYLEIERLNNRKFSKRNTRLINISNHHKYIKNSNELVYYMRSYMNINTAKFITFHIIYDVKNKTSFITSFENRKKIFNENKVSLDSITMENINFFVKKDFDEIEKYVLSLKYSSLPESTHEYYYLNLDSINKSYKFILNNGQN